MASWGERGKQEQAGFIQACRNEHSHCPRSPACSSCCLPARVTAPAGHLRLDSLASLTTPASSAELTSWQGSSLASRPAPATSWTGSAHSTHSMHSIESGAGRHWAARSGLKRCMGAPSTRQQGSKQPAAVTAGLLRPQGSCSRQPQCGGRQAAWPRRLHQPGAAGWLAERCSAPYLGVWYRLPALVLVDELRLLVDHLGQLQAAGRGRGQAWHRQGRQSEPAGGGRHWSSRRSNRQPAQAQPAAPA